MSRVGYDFDSLTIELEEMRAERDALLVELQQARKGDYFWRQCYNDLRVKWNALASPNELRRERDDLRAERDALLRELGR